MVLISATRLLQKHTLGHAAPAQQANGFSPAKAIGLFAYPKNNQPPDEQLQDESACYASAQQNTGIAPQASPPAAKPAEQEAAEQKAAADNAPQKKGGRVRGAARGAAWSAAIGAIAAGS